MKQFQVVQQTPDLNNGLITANFALPIRIEPYSQITLDKFQATIDQTLTKINLSNQILSITLNGTNYYTISIPAANYNTVTDFLQVFIQKINSSFNSFVPANFFNYGLGLKIEASIIANSLTMNYVSVGLYLITADDAEGCVPDDNEIYVYDGNVDKIWYHTSDDVTILRGGGFYVSALYRPDVVGGQYVTVFKLIDESVVDGTKFVALTQEESTSPSEPGDITIFTPANVPILLPSTIFYNGNTPKIVVIKFSQVDGYYHIDIFDFDEVPTTLLYSYGGINETGLGVWTINDSNTARFAGSSSSVTPYPVQTDNPGFSVEYNATQDSITGSGLNYSVLIDLTQADQIRLGLGLTPNLVVFSPLNSNAASFLSTNSINFSSIRSALSLSLEVLEIPLDSYIFGSSTFYGKGAKPPPSAITAQRQPGQRVNVISYFVPQITDIASNLFRYQSSEYQWLNMVNKQPIEFSSLTFRVYVTETGEPIQANNLSFNFLTRDREEAGFSQSNSNEVVSKFQYK